VKLGARRSSENGFSVTSMWTRAEFIRSDLDRSCEGSLLPEPAVQRKIRSLLGIQNFLFKALNSLIRIEKFPVLFGLRGTVLAAI
jgi:hypothetical protein